MSDRELLVNLTRMAHRLQVLAKQQKKRPRTRLERYAELTRIKKGK